MQWPLVGRGAALDHVVELIDGGTGIAILGPAGVGKSRLLHELIGRAERSDMAVVSVVASQSTRHIPFAPFVELLPSGPTQDLLSMLSAARSALEDSAGRHGLLLAIDDAHQLDETSLAFLVSAINTGVATVALTARTGESMESDLVDLWTNGVIERIDVGPLSRADHRLLLENRLGEVTNELESELWRLAEGNPLVLHELIEGGVDLYIHEGEDNTWALAGPLVESPRLSDLVTSRLRALPDELRPGMDAVAVGAPLPWRLADEAIGTDLSRLEELGLIATSGTGGDKRLVAAHPLYGEILKAHIGEARVRAACRALVEAATRVPSTPDSLQVALWQRDCGEVVSGEIAMAGAREALVRHEPGLTEELLQPLGTEDDRVALLLGRALSYTQRFVEAEQILAGRAPSDPATQAEIASIRAQNMAFGLGEVPSARAIIEEATEHIEDADLRARLINERAMVSAVHGDFVDSISASDAVLSVPNISIVPRAAAYVSLSVALAMTGDSDRLEQIADDALGIASLSRNVLPFARDQIEVMQVLSHLNAGRVSEAIVLCEDALQRVDRGNAVTTTWMSALSIALVANGRLEEAVTVGSDALQLFAESDPFGLEIQTRGLLALAHGKMGDPSRSQEIEDTDVTSFGPRLTVWVKRGRAWSAAARGEIEAAAQIAAEAGRESLGAEHFAWAGFCFSDAVRLGHPQLVIEDLRQIDSSHGAHLIATIKNYGEAALSEDAEGLESAATRFTSFRANLLAAEAYAHASSTFARVGEEHRAARCAALSMDLESSCQSPRTPALNSRPSLVSPREIEVALDAASGLTSPTIAEKRFISVRTVDNHLSSVYRKLGVGGREELAEVFAHRSRNEETSGP